MKDYVEDLAGSSMTGRWNPKGVWHEIHEDKRLIMGGKFTLAAMQKSGEGTDSAGGKYKVKLMEDGLSVKELEYDQEDEPSFDTIVADLKTAFGV